MKPGDLVQFKGKFAYYGAPAGFGIILHLFQDQCAMAHLLWHNGIVSETFEEMLEVISEAR